MKHQPRPRSTDDRLNITGLAETLREEGVAYDDDRISAEDRGLRSFDGQTWQEQEGDRVGAAAQEAVMSEVVRESTPQAAAAQDLYGQIQTELPQARRHQDVIAASKQETEEIRNLGHADRPRGAKGVSWAAKALMVTGDTFLLGMQLAGPGNNPIVSGLAGVAIATGAVAAGSVLGKDYALAKQRRQRGPATKETPASVRSLMQSPNEGPPIDRLWALITGAFMIGVGASIGMFLLGTAGILEEAIGVGVVTSLTVLGSAVAEAYGTNAAADRLAVLARAIKASDAWIAAFARRVGAQRRHLTQSQRILAAGAHEAISARLAHQTMASPMASNPRLFDYEARQDAGAFTATLPETPDSNLTDLDDVADLLDIADLPDDEDSEAEQGAADPHGHGGPRPGNLGVVSDEEATGS